MFIQIPESLKKLSKFFSEDLFAVGGYVRNQLLNLGGGDVDLCSSVDIEEVSKRLAGTEFAVKVKNLKLGSILISCKDETFEYTAFRKEEYAEGGAHCPRSIVRTDKIEEDVLRRDFSINSIYYNINKDECVDLCHGVIDLTDRVLRAIKTPDDVFCHDGERILRMVRIAGELNFKIDKKTLAAAKKFVGNLKDISGNRKFAELEKILYCDKRYGNTKIKLNKVLELLNDLGVWHEFGLNAKKIEYKMTGKCEDRLLGLFIDIVDSEKPECLESFLEQFLKEQFGLVNGNAKKIIVLLSGYYHALYGMKNKEYFFKYFENWAGIYPLLGAKSKHVQNKYNFFYKYIIEHNLIIKLSDLKINEKDIAEKFKSIDKRNYNRILWNLLSKVFDGKLANEKENLLAEIEKNLVNY